MGEAPELKALGNPVIRFGEVTSTMEIARRLVTLGASEGAFVVATSQTAGRGRAGRTWHSAPGKGLYCSLILRPTISAARFLPFSVVTGLAICSALDRDMASGIELKWPNDLVYQGRKLGGILVSTSLVGDFVDSAIVGVGLNLLPDRSRPEQAISLLEIEDRQSAPTSELLSRIAESLTIRYLQLLAGDVAGALDGWNERLAFLGQEVTLQDGSQTHIGAVEGISSNGSLLLKTTGGIRAIRSGDLTRGPRWTDPKLSN